MRRRLAFGAVTAMAAGAAIALAQGGSAPVAPASWSTHPEVPGAARTLVPFGIEVTPAGKRAWALGLVGSATVVLQRAPTGAWTATPLPVAGRPVGGDKAPQHAGEMTADGHGAVLLVAPDRPGQPATLLTRAPGAAFVAAPDPAGALGADEQLVGDQTAATARTLLAATGGDDAATYVAPTTADGVARAVLRLDAGGWHREPVDAPGLTEPFHPVGLSAAGPARAWMLGTSGGRVVLLRRDPGTSASVPTAPRWVPENLDDDLLDGRAPPAGIAKVEVSAPPADPLTATADGAWIDLRVTPAGATAAVDVTEHLKVTEPQDGGSGTTTTTTVPATTTGTDTTATETTTTETTPTTTTGATTPPQEPKLAVDGRWCDLPKPAAGPGATASAPLCDHPLGFTFAHGDRGYRSVATPATPEAKFGTREISAPVDLGVVADARAHDAQRQGGYAALDGDTFALRDGIGEDGSSTTQAIAFAADGTGFTGGTIAFGAVSRTPYSPPPEESLPYQGDVLIAGAAAPNGDGRILALARQGGAVLYTPGSGWAYANSAVLGVRTHDRYITPRVIVWPRPNVVISGGAAGQLATADADPVGVVYGFAPAPPPPQHAVNFDALALQATILAIACTPSDPLDCVAVGRDGLIVRGDGRNWNVQSLPGSAPDHTDITGVAFDGRIPLLATTDGLYRGQASGGGYERDDDLRTRMRTAGLPAAVSQVATVAGGGVVVDGRFARDSATAAWRPTGAPLELFPFALAAYRDAGGAVRAIVSATPDRTPLPDAIQPDEDDLHPPADGKVQHDPPPLAPSPVGAVTLRETADGWVDLDGSSFQPSGGRDLPDMTPNTRAMIVDGDGNGILLGGVSDPSTSQLYGPSENPPTLNGVASVRRLERGAVVPPPPSTDPAPAAAESAPPPGSVRLAVGGHATCLDRCGAAAGQGYAPDTHLEAATARIRAMTAGGAGPAALLIGGGRASVGGDPLDVGGARRYRELVQGAGVPTYVLPGPGDLPSGGASAFASAFASAPAPQGTGDASAGIDLSNVPQPGPADPDRARNTFAFDVRAPAGAVRVIAIDNAAGRLAGGTDGPQAQWIRAAMDQAHSLGMPSIVVGSMPLDSSQAATPAADADAEIALLAGHASAYVATAGVDDPDDRHFGGVMAQSLAAAPGGAPPLPLLQSSTLGYGPAQSFFRGAISESEITRQTTAALLVLDVAVDRMDPATGLAPIGAMSEPLLEGLSLDQASRSVPLGWAQQLQVTAYDPSPRRFLMSPAPGAAPRPASPGLFGSPLVDQCRFFVAVCTTVVPTDMLFASSNPNVARFVAVRLGREATRGRAEVILDSSGHVIDDPHGFFCPLGLGSVDVSVTALGRRVSAPVQVIPVPSMEGSNVRTDPIPPGTCAFPVFTRIKEEKKPVVAPEKPAPAPRPAPAPKPVHHHHHPAQHHAVAPAPPPPVPVPAPPAPAPAPPPAADHARPPVAPAPKPPTPSAPPAPPQGLQVQQVQVQQVQPFQAMQHQEQRREEYAFENDSAAVAYAHPPSPLPWEIAGGAALLALVMAGGGLAGRARRRATVPAAAGTRSGGRPQ